MLARYFAYGSNLNPQQMQDRCDTTIEDRGAARLDGYRLVFAGTSKNWREGGVATIVPNPGRSVAGRIYALADEALARLDDFEGNYHRVEIEIAGETLWTYVRRSDQPRNAPCPEYLAHMAHAYGELGFELLELLHALPSA